MHHSKGSKQQLNKGKRVDDFAAATKAIDKLETDSFLKGKSRGKGGSKCRKDIIVRYHQRGHVRVDKGVVAQVQNAYATGAISKTLLIKQVNKLLAS